MSLIVPGLVGGMYEFPRIGEPVLVSAGVLIDITLLQPCPATDDIGRRFLI